MRTAPIAAALALTLASTIALAQSVSYDFDRSVNFSKFRTYAWTHGTELDDQLNHARVVRAIESQLAAKGLTKVDAGAGPDLLVAYHASFDRNLQIDALGNGWGGARFGALRSGTATTHEIVTGTVVVDLLDAATRGVVWRGVASDDLDSGASPQKREKNINKAAQKVFKNYPPRS
jgi:hypothetical protein